MVDLERRGGSYEFDKGGKKKSPEEGIPNVYQQRYLQREKTRNFTQNK